MTPHAATTDALSASFLDEIRGLLDLAFHGDFTDDDWHHARGGVHVWLAGPQGLLSHASLLPRTLVCSGHRLNVGYVEAVATAGPHRRQGLGAAVMKHIGELIRGHYALGALSTGTHSFYTTLGWELWRGRTFVEGPLGVERTPDDDGGVMILRTSRSPGLNLDEDIVCDWRAGDVW